MFRSFHILLGLVAIIFVACSAGSDTGINNPSNNGDNNSLADKQGPGPNATWDKNFDVLVGSNDTVKYITAVDGKVYAFGVFERTAKGVRLDGVMRIDTTIVALSEGPELNGDSLHGFANIASDGSTVFALPYYYNTAQWVVKFDGTNWTFPSTGPLYNVNNLAVAGGELFGSYRVGYDTAICVNFSSANIYGSGFGVPGEVVTMAGFGKELYGATIDDSVYLNPVTEFIHFDGTNWSHMQGWSLPGKVHTIKKVGGQLYAMGDPGPGSRTFFIGHWTGSKWEQVSTDMMGDMSEILADFDVDKDGHYYAATSELIYKWDGHEWSVLGSTNGGYIHSMLIYKGMLVVGGTFYGIGDIPAVRSRCIAVYH